MKAISLIAISLIMLSCIICTARAADGGLDSSFGNDGQIYTPLSQGLDVAYAVAVQSDGQVLVAGSRNASQFAIVRYDGSTGAIDTSFGQGGIALTTVSVEGGPGAIEAISVGNDGKILVAGTAYTPGVQGQYDRLAPALARYNSDGSPDQGFGSDGFIVLPIDGKAAIFASMLVQPDGRIVAAGGAGWGPQENTLLARFDSKGTPDPEFGEAGLAQDTSIPVSSASAIALQGDGSFLVLGGAACQVALTHFLASGVRDTSFATDGNAIFTKDGVCIGGSSMARQGGKLIVAGFVNNSSHFSALLIRLNLADGSLDTTFGDMGFVITTLSGPTWFSTGDFYANAVAVLADGKIVIAGGTRSSSLSNFTLARYFPDGALDSDFGHHGIVNSFGTPDQYFNALTVQEDGKIVAAGTATVNGQFSFGTARYLSSPPNHIFCGNFDSPFCSP